MPEERNKFALPYARRVRRQGGAEWLAWVCFACSIGQLPFLAVALHKGAQAASKLEILFPLWGMLNLGALLSGALELRSRHASVRAGRAIAIAGVVISVFTLAACAIASF